MLIGHRQDAEAWVEIGPKTRIVVAVEKTEKTRGRRTTAGLRNRPGASNLRVNPKTLQQEIVEKLRLAILGGMFKPGDRLVEVDLCASLGVSRPSLREALRSLHAERLIEIVPNRGPHIPVLSWEDAQNIYHVREILEGEAAALCAETITKQELKELSDALKAFREAVEQEDAVFRVEATDRFYDVILRACGNPIIEELIGGLRARINFLRGRSMSQAGRAKHSLKEMKAIYLAIEAKDPEAARKAARQHVSKAKEVGKATFIGTN